jgi:hypothetical protein
VSIPDVVLTWHAGGGDIMSRAKHVPSTTPGEPGLHIADDLKPGTAYLVQGTAAAGQPHLQYVCPCGCSQVGVLPLAPVLTMGEKGWEWNGERLDIVLRPSIAKRFGCCWHGFLGGSDGKKPAVWETCAGWVWGKG